MLLKLCSWTARIPDIWKENNQSIKIKTSTYKISRLRMMEYVFGYKYTNEEDKSSLSLEKVNQF